jgi:hypothetical protein
MWESLLTFDIFNKLQRRTTRIHPSYKFVDVTQFHIHRTEFVISSYNMLYISNNLQVHYDTNQISNFYINSLTLLQKLQITWNIYTCMEEYV